MDRWTPAKAAPTAPRVGGGARRLGGRARRPERPGARRPGPASSVAAELVVLTLVAVGGLAAVLAPAGPPEAGGWGFFAPGQAAAQDRVLLGELVPALAGSDLATIDVGPAPPPGASRRVTRAEMIAALRAAGRQPEALRLPAAVRIRRGARRLAGGELDRLVQAAMARDLAPCEVLGVQVSGPVTVAEGPLTARADADLPLRSGEARVAGAVTLSARGRETRLPVRARVRCPDPVMAPGTPVRILAVVGRVRVSAMGEARQAGRVGDVIRVTNGATEATVEARVLDGSTVQVVLR